MPAVQVKGSLDLSLTNLTTVSLNPLLFAWDHHLHFHMQSQLESEWCWSATSTSVSHFFYRFSAWTQCNVVNAELGQTTCCVNGGSNECNQPWYLDKALTRTDNLKGMVNNPVTQSQLDLELAKGRPLGTRIGWFGGGGHFMVLTAYSSLLDRVEVKDPIYGRSIYDYNSYKTNYQGAGSWTHSYYTKCALPHFPDIWEEEKLPFEMTPLPSEIQQIFDKELLAPLRSPSPVSEKSAMFSIKSPVELHMPHAVYVGTLEAFAGDNALEKTQLKAWRQLLTTDSQTFAAVEVQADSQQKATTFSHINEGPYVEGTVSTLRQVRNLTQIQSGQYQFSLLRIPALYIVALWFKSKTGKDDILVPLAPTPSYFKAGQDYTITEFENIIRPFARKRLDVDNPTLGG